MDSHQYDAARQLWVPLMRRIVLILLAVGIPLLWSFVPYGRVAPGMMGEPGAMKTFATTMTRTATEAWGAPKPFNIETFLMLTIFPGLLTPLYPAMLAMLLLIAPRWLVNRRRWVWIVEGVLVLLMTPIGMAWAMFALLILVPGAVDPRLYPTFWLLCTSRQ